MITFSTKAGPIEEQWEKYQKELRRPRRRFSVAPRPSLTNTTTTSSTASSTLDSATTADREDSSTTTDLKKEMSEK